MSARVISIHASHLFSRFSRSSLSPPLSGLKASEADELETERPLSLARALLAIAGLIAITIDPTTPERYATFVSVVLSGYAIYSAALMVALRATERIRPALSRAIHVIDVV